MRGRACIAAIYSCRFTQQAISFGLEELTMLAADQQKSPYKVLWAEEDVMVLLAVGPGPGAKLARYCEA